MQDAIPSLDATGAAGGLTDPDNGAEGGGAVVTTALGTKLSTQVLVAFIDSVKERFGVEPVCRVLSQFVCKIAPSTYYAVKTREPSARQQRDEKVKEVLADLWNDPDVGRGVLGARKMWKLLHAMDIRVDGQLVARCTIERLMRELGLVGALRGGSFHKTTHADPDAERSPDLVGRNFTAPAPNRLWVVDFTYLNTAAGKAYAAFVLDVFSRRIMGWAVSDRHVTELPLAALEMAIYARARTGQDVAGLVHHSDAGSEYTAIAYRKVLGDFDALASIGTVGDSYDNAMAESLMGIYKAECFHQKEEWVDAREIEMETGSWVHWYNTRRPHSSIGDRAPIEYEYAYYNGELPEPEENSESEADTEPAGQADSQGEAIGQHDQARDNDRDINPRTHQRAG